MPLKELVLEEEGLLEKSQRSIWSSQNLSQKNVDAMSNCTLMCWESDEESEQALRMRVKKSKGGDYGWRK